MGLAGARRGSACRLDDGARIDARAGGVEEDRRDVELAADRGEISGVIAVRGVDVVRGEGREERLGRRIDIITERSLSPHLRDRILSEARPL